MLLTAAAEMDIDLNTSWMIGDTAKDIEAGYRAGCRTILVEPPSRQRQIEGFDHPPDYRAINLKEAVTIVRMYGRSERDTQRKAELSEPGEVRTSTLSSESKAEVPSMDAQRTEEAFSKVRNEEIASKPDESSVVSTTTAADAEPVRDVEPAQEQEQEVQQEPAKEASDKSESESQVLPAEPEPVPAEPERGPSNGFILNNQDQDDKLRSILEDVEEQQSVESLLTAILEEIKTMQRRELYSDFSVMRLLAGIVQVLVLFCLIVTVWFLMSPKSQEGAVAFALGLAVVFQLMALTFYTMHGRK
jgi:hypothetical protein